MLYKNIHRINKGTLIHISYKLHGTSFISSRILCKKKLNIFEKILKKLGININDSDYDYIYASRKVIKNSELNPDANHFYNEDIWALAHESVKEYLEKGMTLYGEIVGYLPSGGYIQKDYDYGCNPLEFKVYIYRITHTNPDGKVIEFSAKQVRDWCNKNGLNPVPQLYYGYAEDLIKSDENIYNNEDSFENNVLTYIKQHYNEKKCFICKNNVPEEGCVVRIEGLEFEAYKQKSNRFYERETKELDSGEINIEDLN